MAKSVIERGGLVSDEIIVQIIEKKITEYVCPDRSVVSDPDNCPIAEQPETVGDSRQGEIQGAQSEDGEDIGGIDDELILRDPDPYFRVLNLATNTFNEGITSYFHKSVGGYSAIKMRRYQDIIEEHISKNNIRVLNMLNTKYFILVNEEGQTRAQPNPAALGSCWLVKEARVVENADQENEALKTFDPARTALVDQRFKGHMKEFVFDSLAQIRLENYHPMKMSYRFSAGSDQLAVFSDVYYQPGWHSYVDGQPVPHFRVNYILRGMMIPAGEHSITFEFRPPSYFTGEKAGLAASILVILVFGLSLFMVIREKE